VGAVEDAASAWAVATASHSPPHGASGGDGATSAHRALPQAMELLAAHCPSTLPLVSGPTRSLFSPHTRS
jgi:hypothetical protein